MTKAHVAMRMFCTWSLIILISKAPANGQLVEPDLHWRFEELLVVGDNIFIGATPEWFPANATFRVFSYSEGIYNYLQVGEGRNARFISADKDGQLFVGAKRDPNSKEWNYYGPVRVADEALTAVAHQSLTMAWRDESDPKERGGVWPVLLRPEEEPTIIRDKDGVERKIFRAVLRKQPFHDQYRFTVSRVRKEEFYPNPFLLGTGRYGVRGLCVYRGEVYYGNVKPNQFDKQDWTDYWLPDAPFLVTKWDGKFRLLSVTEEGEIRLTDRATLNTYWRFSKPKKEVRESSIGFQMYNFKAHRDSQEIRYLVPDDKPFVVKDRDGKEVELFRLKLGKEPKYYQLHRYAP